MSLVNIYKENFGGEKQAESAELTDEQLNEALSKMSEEDVKKLAKDVADGIKSEEKGEKQGEKQGEKTAESKETSPEDSEKTADELFAGGQIFAQGFLKEFNGAEAKEATEQETPLNKFAKILKAELAQ